MSPISILLDIYLDFIKDIAVPKCTRFLTSSAQLNQLILRSSVSKCLKVAFCSAFLLADEAYVDKTNTVDMQILESDTFQSVEVEEFVSVMLKT